MRFKFMFVTINFTVAIYLICGSAIRDMAEDTDVACMFALPLYLTSCCTGTIYEMLFRPGAPKWYQK